MESGKSCGIAYAGSATYYLHCGTQEDVFQFSTDFSLTWFSSFLLPRPLMSREITVCWQALVSLSLRKIIAKWETSPSCHHTWPGGMEEILTVSTKISLIWQIGYAANYHAGFNEASHTTFNFLDHNF